jgi:hypothetical protein
MARSVERQALADAQAHRDKLQGEQSRLRTAATDWEPMAALREQLETAQATLESLRAEATERRFSNILDPAAAAQLIPPEAIEVAEKDITRLSLELADRETIRREMQKRVSDPERLAQLQMAETAVQNAVATVVMAELPEKAYLLGRLAIAAYQGARRAPPPPSAEDLAATTSRWENFGRQLLRGEIDAPAPNLHPDGT